MRVTARSTCSVAILDIDGRLVVEEDLSQLDAFVESHLRTGSKDIAFNLERTTQLDAAGLGKLTYLYGRITAEGGRLRLYNVQRRLEYLLDITGLSTAFQVFDSENAAVASLRPSMSHRSLALAASRASGANHVAMRGASSARTTSCSGLGGSISCDS